MDNLDDSENAKVSDSAYSNSCSNSQSRRSHSSKSTHSGSNSSGSSGYGGLPSTSGSSTLPPEKRSKDKDHKTKKQMQDESAETDAEVECLPLDPLPEAEAPKEEDNNVDQTVTLALAHDKGPESMDISSPSSVGGKDEVLSCNLPLSNAFANYVTNRPVYNFSWVAKKFPENCKDGFSCVISMHDGVVMYTTSQLTATLGFPKDMWIGRSFIDFVHPRDQNTFASQITSGLAVQKIVDSSEEIVPGNTMSMVCRIRRYRGLASGFGVKERVVTFMPFLLKLSFKSASDEKGEVTYLVLNATPFFSAFKVSNEVVVKPVPFVIRHAANGNLEYLDPESVPYLGYLPQDVIGEDALKLYHPDDLCYLSKVYKIIVKEGGLSRSKPYRMLTQNGFYVRIETEWSSYINPWSRKLEFVIGKHSILEGPINPDVFQTPEEMKSKVKEEEKNKLQAMRDHIIKILNEVLTKPAEVAKQQMSKRCQDLASFMETLLEDQPKTDDELRLEIQDADHSYYERDSMLGGISPHHDYDDSKSSTETPLSYNQLNHNDNLQRYFDSHLPLSSYEDYNTVTGENVLTLKNSKPYPPKVCMSPTAQNSGDSVDMNGSYESGLAVVQSGSPIVHVGDYQHVWLTETLINKHNTEMEKELFRAHRETRSSSKCEREKTSNENRQKKKEHLARCNASFQPAAVATTAVEPTVGKKSHGVKRSSKQAETETIAHKHHCASRQSRRRQATTAPPAAATTDTPNVGPGQWHMPNSMNNPFVMGMGMPPQMSIISPVMSQQMAHMSGMFVMYYVPPGEPVPPNPNARSAQTSCAEMPNKGTTSNSHAAHNLPQGSQFQPPAMQCMMYGQAMYGSPFMCVPTAAPASSHGFHMGPVPQAMTSQAMPFTEPLYPLGLTRRNYEEACKLSVPAKPNKSSGGWRNMKRGDTLAASSKTNLGSTDNITSTSALIRESGEIGGGTQGVRKTGTLGDERSSTNSFSPKSTEAVPSNDPRVVKGNMEMRNSDEAIDRTDGESSYSSFYSSFFRTDSGSAEESGDMKKGCDKIRTSTSEFWDKSTPDDQSSLEATPAYREPNHHKKVTRRKMEPPWMEQVCVTSELVYKYQILTKTMDEVLTADKQKMSNLTQPSLVNEQLGQLYLDMQLEGVAARLTLEDGITSSSSSGEENTNSNSTKGGKRKRAYSKLVMIYEEDAPLPPPSTDEESQSAT